MASKRDDTDDDDDTAEEEEEDASSTQRPTTKLRIRLHGSQLPKQGKRFRKRLPTTYAVVTCISSTNDATVTTERPSSSSTGINLAASTTTSPPPQSNHGGANIAVEEHLPQQLRQGYILGETEVIVHDANPQWTTTISIAYEYGTAS